MRWKDTAQQILRFGLHHYHPHPHPLPKEASTCVVPRAASGPESRSQQQAQQWFNRWRQLHSVLSRETPYHGLNAAVSTTPPSELWKQPYRWYNQLHHHLAREALHGGGRPIALPGGRRGCGHMQRGAPLPVTFSRSLCAGASGRAARWGGVGRGLRLRRWSSSGGSGAAAVGGALQASLRSPWVWNMVDCGQQVARSTWQVGAQKQCLLMMPTLQETGPLLCADTHILAHTQSSLLTNDYASQKPLSLLGLLPRYMLHPLNSTICCTP